MRVSLNQLVVAFSGHSLVSQRQFEHKGPVLRHGSRVAFVFGTRPEVVKLAPVIRVFKRRGYRPILVSTGQHASMLMETLDVFGLHEDLNLSVMQRNQSLTTLTSKLGRALGQVFDSQRPDLVVVQGDTTTAYVAALEAFYRHIPVAHVEAGLRTYDVQSPFPEEFNRQAIGLLASFHFAATERSARNLLREGKHCQSVFITGNTVVDALREVSSRSGKTDQAKELEKLTESRCHGCRTLLLTTHRRENQGRPMTEVFRSVCDLLRKFEDLLVIFPMHKNPNVRQALLEVVPVEVLVKCEGFGELPQEWGFLKRFLITKPFDYETNVQIMKSVALIMTDSGGIQEEGVSLGKPVFVLRNTTERPEGVEAGGALLVGTDQHRIASSVGEALSSPAMLQRMSGARSVYGHGNSSEQIVDILEGRVVDCHACALVAQPNQQLALGQCYDLVAVLTVWKRANLRKQLIAVSQQSVLQNHRSIVIVFQNGRHINVEPIVREWQEVLQSKGIKVLHVWSELETGYFGRFVAPLLVDTCSEAIWLIHDDDVLFGSRYWENMFRVVESGYLATRNCRVLDREGRVVFPPWGGKKFVTFERDLVCDYGGHIWCGRIQWLKNAWTHPPFDVSNCEDFWLSAVLSSYYGIGTKSPACPHPSDQNANFRGELCACAEKSFLKHEPAHVGATATRDAHRSALLASIARRYNVTLVADSSPPDFRRYSSRQGDGYVHESNARLFELPEFLADCATWN